MTTYRNVADLHRGARSTITRAVRESDGTPVILKYLTTAVPQPRDLASFEFSFVAGSRGIKGVSHAVDRFEVDRRPVLVFADIGGRSLDLVIATRRLTVAETLRVFIPVVRGLMGLHESDIVHADVKPANIVISEATGAVELIDLGAGIFQEPAQENHTPRYGTLAYISPEQTGRTSLGVDYRTDLYAVGVAMFQCLTGRLPFTALDPLELVHAHIALRPPSACELNPALPAPLGEIIARLLQKSPSDRYQSAAGLAHDLEHCLDELERHGRIDPFELGTQDLGLRLREGGRIVGRDAELAELRRSLERVATVGPEILLIEGRSGVGKSAFVGEVRGLVAAARGLYGRGKFAQLHNAPYSALTSALTEIVHDLLARPPEAVARLREALDRVLGEAAGPLYEILPDLALLRPRTAEPGGLDLAVERQNRLLYLLVRFLEVIAPPEAPVVLFIDDLQWADAATLGLLDNAIADPRTGAVLVLGAFREETPAGHPVRLLGAGQADGGRVRHLHLGPLSSVAVAEMIADRLASPLEAVSALAERVGELTDGNPLLIDRVLWSLVESGALRVDSALARWVWDDSALRVMGLDADAASAVGRQIDGLAPATMSALALAGALGDAFLAADVAALAGTGLEETAHALFAATDARFLTCLGDQAGVAGTRAAERTLLDLGTIRFRFQHDRLREVAYASIKPEDRAPLHRRIGVGLAAKLAESEEGDALFAAVDHLNLGNASAHLPELSASLNLRAARVARTGAAFAAAYRYLDEAVRAMGESAWETQRGRAWAAHLALSEMAGVCQAEDRAAALFESNLARAQTLAERVTVHSIRVEQLSRSNIVGAVLHGVGALSLFGFEAPPPDPALWGPHIGAEQAQLMPQLMGGALAGFMAAPAMDEEHEQQMQILGMLGPASFVLPFIFPFVTMRNLNLSIAHGISRSTPMGLACQAIMLAGGGMAPEALGMVQLALAIDAQRAGDRRQYIEMVAGGFVYPWVKPYRESRPILESALRSALEKGDFGTASWSTANLISQHFANGLPLPRFTALCWEYLRLNRVTLRNADIANAMALTLRTAAELAGDRVTLDALDSAGDTRERITAALSHYMIALISTIGEQILAACILEDWDKANALAEAYTPMLPGAAGSMVHAHFQFCAHLAMLGGERPGAAEKAVAVSDQLAGFAKHSPENFAHQEALLRAELARASGDEAGAMRQFDLAVEHASVSAHLHMEGLTLERAGVFYASLGRRRVAATYLQDARLAYLKWGALAKVKALDTQIGEGRESPGADRATTQLVTGPLEFDRASLMKAATAIGAEIVLDRLLTRLVEIVAENAGADIGVVLRVRPDGLFVAAQTDAETRKTRVVNEEPLGPSVPVCARVARKVALTGETVLIADARREPELQGDPALAERGTRAILCVPVGHQGSVPWLIYLENRSTAGAFPPQNLATVSLLASQAAISLENARLYDELSRTLEAQVRLTRAHERFVPTEFLESIGRSSIGDVELGDSAQKEMSLLYSDIRDFTALVEGMKSEENIAFINEFLSMMEPAILRHKGFVDSYIGDAILALFDDGADSAVRGAIDMLRALPRFNAFRATRSLAPLRIGVGVNTGVITMGTIGGAERMKCGVIGDPVNLTARVEGMTKHYGVPLIISGNTASRLRAPEAFNLRWLDRVRVKGRAEAVELIEVYDTDLEPGVKHAAAALWTEAMEAYAAGALSRSRASFLEYGRRVSGDPVAARFVARCDRYEPNLDLATWTGVEVWDVK